MDSLKCYVCKKTKPKSEFQSFKSCQSCRKKKSTSNNKKDKEKDSIPIETFAKLQQMEPIRTEPINTIEKRTSTRTEWCVLSGKWIRRGEEQRLHNLLLKKVNRQFLSRCAFPVHKYLTKCMMSDIRDV